MNLSPSREARFRELYAAGVSLKQIRIELALAWGTTRRLPAILGLEPRPKKPPCPPFDFDLLVKLRSDGLSGAKIAQALGISHEQALWQIEKHRLPAVTKGPPAARQDAFPAPKRSVENQTDSSETGRPPPAPKPVANPPEAPISADGHRWDRVGRVRTCLTCGLRQFVREAANPLQTSAYQREWLPTVAECTRAKTTSLRAPGLPPRSVTASARSRVRETLSAGASTAILGA